MFVTMSELLNRAKKERYAVAAANVFNDRTVKECFTVADRLKSPIIMACTSYVPMEELALLAQFYEKQYPHVPIALNLDHGSDYEQAIRAIRCGFTSVMIDKSTFPFEENVNEVREVVKAAHAIGVSVEAELGHVGKGFEYEKTRESGLTRKEDALRFVQKTNVDCLAVAIGTSHGVYSGKPHLDFDLLKALSKLVPVPLVLHGGSNTGEEKIKKAIALGIQKVNLSTDLVSSYIEGISRFVKEKGSVLDESGKIIYSGNRAVLANQGHQASADAWGKTLASYMQVFGSVNRA